MATQGCPCGFLGHPRKPCKCTPRQVQLYRARLSGPLLDRIDMHVEVPAVTARELLRGVRGASRLEGIRSPSFRSGPRPVRGECSIAKSGRGVGAERVPATAGTHREATERMVLSGDGSAAIRARVEAARALQHRRFEGRPRVRANADMGLAELDAFCRLDLESTALLQRAVESFSLSARAAHRCLRVARTVADLAGAAEIASEHVAEAVQYQVLEGRE